MSNHVQPIPVTKTYRSIYEILVTNLTTRMIGYQHQPRGCHEKAYNQYSMFSGIILNYNQQSFVKLVDVANPLNTRQLELKAIYKSFVNLKSLKGEGK